ncbi:16S rRNA (uracil(1498)-N(3))-methyltransferase [Methylomonas koyamae]|uniref:Ribosomal RNA small subunit methyltransferase E n=1 Tax=Methylomonas koyamae TaxID=702114 RepID=A0A291IEX0_9GAMM|nr:16S rRNA (uracil(1498)-N(3))-methyltransferase [Methylomonas koyamae]ATG88884.1 16S rRNA methyltransferase [Methylomonas koyamae]OAI28499.1 16S rRNA (uracil(1498)-N(3))-methyltransferase [Methylomonas koyamae]
MRVSRLYVDVALNVGQQVELNDAAGHYLRTVLRLKRDQDIILFNGRSGEYRCRLDEVSRKRVSVAVEQFIDRSVESPLAVHLGLGISRGDRMDWAVQKAVELGVASLTPLISERCVIKFDDDKKQQRQQHWQGIIQHAAEQSGRTRLPSLNPPCELAEWVDGQSGLKLFLDPYADQVLSGLNPEGEGVTLLSGPEGGFSDQERQYAKAAGFVPVRMGGRILRSETAVLAALAAVQTLWGDFR